MSFKNKFWKDPSKENELLFKTERKNVSHCGENALNHTFKMLLRKSCHK